MLTQLLSIEFSKFSMVGTQPRGSLQSLCITPCSQCQEVKFIEEATAASDKQRCSIFFFFFFSIHKAESWSLYFLQALCFHLAVSSPLSRRGPVFQWPSEQWGLDVPHSKVSQQQGSRVGLAEAVVLPVLCPVLPPGPVQRLVAMWNNMKWDLFRNVFCSPLLCLDSLWTVQLQQIVPDQKIRLPQKVLLR